MTCETITGLDIGIWVQEKAEFVLSCLERERQAILTGLGNNRPHLDLDNRSLSEMPLCHSWQNIPMPPGYKVARGEVQIRSGLRRIGYPPHTFALNQEKRVLCFTFGQFSNPGEENQKPGERINKLKSKAPDLITLLPCGLSYLHGTIDDIKARLNLHYKESDLYPFGF